MQRYACTCAYDGTDFSGWQVQPGARTVQEVIETRLASVLETPTRIHASGRTDTGVHARGQVFHFDAAWTHAPENLHRALQSGLPSAIAIRSLTPVEDDFHARFSATGKRYVYRIALGKADPFTVRYTWAARSELDATAMQAAGTKLLGTHDFAPFAAKRHNESDDNTIRTLRRLDVTPMHTPTAETAELHITAEANGFLYKMVRGLVGALVSVGRGQLKPEQLGEILAGGLRTHRIETAPPQGLCLEEVFYG